jgi:hypothetical protein
MKDVSGGGGGGEACKRSRSSRMYVESSVSRCRHVAGEGGGERNTDALFMVCSNLLFICTPTRVFHACEFMPKGLT